jgi:hypothetical protein
MKTRDMQPPKQGSNAANESSPMAGPEPFYFLSFYLTNANVIKSEEIPRRRPPGNVFLRA